MGRLQERIHGMHAAQRRRLALVVDEIRAVALIHGDCARELCVAVAVVVVVVGGRVGGGVGWGVGGGGAGGGGGGWRPAGGKQRSGALLRFDRASPAHLLP